MIRVNLITNYNISKEKVRDSYKFKILPNVVNVVLQNFIDKIETKDGTGITSTKT